ncbi:MAG: hypothetical protein V4663_07620 [Bacteroidota bacterium]
MKRLLQLYICIPFIFWLSESKAQDENKLSSISLSVILPTNIDGISDSQLSMLESKIIEASTNNGVSAVGYYQNFVIYPKFEIYAEKQSNGGIRNVTVVDCNINLFIKQLSTNIIFASYSKRIQGSGFNKGEAINNAISSFDSSDEKLNTFVKNGKEKILNYYQANCDIILKKAETERNLKRHESALAVLLTIPEDAISCSLKAQARAKVVYSELQNYNCRQYLQKATAFSAAKDYKAALQYLSWVDPTSLCGSESKKLISVISSKVDSEDKQQWDFLLKTYSDNVALKRAQIQSANSIALAWLRTQGNPTSYVTIIK